MGEFAFESLYLLAEQDESGNKTEHIAVAIVVLSGIGSGDFTLSVPEGGYYLELSIRWPSPFVGQREMHIKWFCSSQTDLDCSQNHFCV